MRLWPPPPRRTRGRGLHTRLQATPYTSRATWLVNPVATRAIPTEVTPNSRARWGCALLRARGSHCRSSSSSHSCKPRARRTRPVQRVCGMPTAMPQARTSPEAKPVVVSSAGDIYCTAAAAPSARCAAEHATRRGTSACQRACFPTDCSRPLLAGATIPVLSFAINRVKSFSRPSRPITSIPGCPMYYVQNSSTSPSAGPSPYSPAQTAPPRYVPLSPTAGASGWPATASALLSSAPTLAFHAFFGALLFRHCSSLLLGQTDVPSSGRHRDAGASENAAPIATSASVPRHLRLLVAALMLNSPRQERCRACTPPPHPLPSPARMQNTATEMPRGWCRRKPKSALRRPDCCTRQSAATDEWHTSVAFSACYASG